jgi:hypothetical protein
MFSKGKIQVGNSRTRCTMGSEDIDAVRARTHEEQCGGQLLPSWNPFIIFLLVGASEYSSFDEGIALC